MDAKDKNLNDRINILEIKLEKIYEEKAKGAQVRVWEQWVEISEKIIHTSRDWKRKDKLKSYK